MHKTILLLFSFLITLLELQAQTLTSDKDGSFSLEVQGKTILVI